MLTVGAHVDGDLMMPAISAASSTVRDEADLAK
jgi:hypothetical protein